MNHVIQTNINRTAASGTLTSTITFLPTITTSLASSGCITFVASRDGNPEIYMVNTESTDGTNLSNKPSFERYPTWSPDGRAIVFTSDRDGNEEIYRMRIDGSGTTHLTQNPEHKWAPDGSQLAECEQASSEVDPL